MGTVIQMIATSAGGNESGLAAIDVPANGNLVGVEWAGHTALDTTADQQAWQLSFGSTFTNQNDSRQVISNVSVGLLTFATAVGATIGRVSQYNKLPDIPVGMGERLYLHSIATATTVGTIRANCHFDFDLDKVATRRR